MCNAFSDDFLLDYFMVNRYTEYGSKVYFGKVAVIVSDFLRRTWAEVDLDALHANYQMFKSHISPDCRCMAVVKADAYGHGAVAVAKKLADADFFGVSNLDEALELRQNGITAPILIFAYTPPEHAATLAAHNITQTALDVCYAEALEEAAAAAGVTVSIHLKIDTGMSRIGFFCQDDTLPPVDAIVRTCSLPHLRADGIFTHFAAADEPTSDAVTRLQFKRFTDVINTLKARGITFPLRHCCASAAALRFPDMHLDMVRVGIALYGASPLADATHPLPLRPVMTLKSVVSQIKTVPAGTAVSYGHTFTCPRETTLATLPIGYADGLPWHASGNFEVSVNGHRAPGIGRVCMDQCLIDITDIPRVEVGTTVTLFGTTDLSVESFSRFAHTIPYDILCAINKRVARIYREKTG